MKSDCCGADVYSGVDGGPPWYCKQCMQRQALVHTAPKLTPEQVAAIRYPTLEECNRMGDSGIATLQLVDWAICYALKDLMPEET